MSEQILAQKKEASPLTTGLALFSMFFGAGNLIFPLLIGKDVGGNAWYAIAGLGLTAVVVPFLGLATMVLFQGNYYNFFGRIGKVPGIFLFLILQLILGPFGVIPRLVTLMHAMTKPYLLHISLMPFSLFIVILIFLCSFKRERIVHFLGMLTPILLLCIATLVLLGLFGVSPLNPISIPPEKSFFQGLVGGYNTMDLIAAFVFATMILPHFRQEMKIENPALRVKSLYKRMIFPSAIAASLLFLTYCSLCLVSSFHGSSLDASIPPEELLSAIAVKLLGPIGGFIAAMSVALACLTTAVTLTSIFAEFLRKDLCREKMNGYATLTITLVITTIFANLGFKGITAFLTPLLQIVYPGLILLTLLNLSHLLFGWRMVKIPVFCTLTCSAIFYLIYS